MYSRSGRGTLLRRAIAINKFINEAKFFSSEDLAEALQIDIKAARRWIRAAQKELPIKLIRKAKPGVCGCGNIYSLQKEEPSHD